MIHKKPKFKKEKVVVFHSGNWKYSVEHVLWNEDGEVIYVLRCIDESCTQAGCADGNHCEIMEEEGLISEAVWDRHSEKGTCKVCCN